MFYASRDAEKRVYTLSILCHTNVKYDVSINFVLFTNCFFEHIGHAACLCTFHLDRGLVLNLCFTRNVYNLAFSNKQNSCRELIIPNICQTDIV